MKQIGVMKTKLLILFIGIYSHSFLFAFDVNLMINKNTFVYEKYNFSVTNVIDARINQKNAVGYYYGGLLNKKLSVGNDSLDKELIRFFNKYSKSFYEPTKIILVINQLNLTEIKFKNADDFEFTLAFDYYRVVGNTARLEYSQFIKFDKGAGTIKENSIAKGFSEAMAFAFLQFKNQLMYYKPLVFTPLLLEDLKVKLTEKLTKRICEAKINEGLYFNINQLLKNAPVISSGCTISNDSTLLSGKTTSINCNSYLVKKAFAIVKNEQLYLYISDGVYLPAEIESNGDIYLKDLYYKRKNNVFSNGLLGGLRGFSPLLALASDITELSQKGELIKIQLDETSGVLHL